MNLELKIIPPIQFIISAGLMFSLNILFPHFYFSLQLNITITVVLVIVASLIGALALYDFHKHQTTFHPHTPEKTSKVVDSGIFAYSRNPMYVSLAVILVAFGVFLQNISSFIIVPIFIYYITRFQIIPEEKMLDKLFPNEYQAYCQKVNRWF